MDELAKREKKIQKKEAITSLGDTSVCMWVCERVQLLRRKIFPCLGRSLVDVATPAFWEKKQERMKTGSVLVL